MGKEIILEIEGKVFEGTLNDTKTAKSLYQNLPMEIEMTRWGGEYYGECDIIFYDKDPKRADMEVGELGYWTAGNALCIFFGKTPSSIDEKPKAISPVIPIGKISGDFNFLENLGQNIKVKVKNKWD